MLAEEGPIVGDLSKLAERMGVDVREVFWKEEKEFKGLLVKIGSGRLIAISSSILPSATRRETIGCLLGFSEIGGDGTYVEREALHQVIENEISDMRTCKKP